MSYNWLVWNLGTAGEHAEPIHAFEEPGDTWKLKVGDSEPYEEVILKGKERNHTWFIVRAEDREEAIKRAKEFVQSIQ